MPELIIGALIVGLGVGLLRYKVEVARRQRLGDAAELRGRTDTFQEIRAAHPEWKDDLDRIEHPRDPYEPDQIESRPRWT